jgi:hypothetical protein
MGTKASFEIDPDKVVIIKRGNPEAKKPKPKDKEDAGDVRV